MQLRRCCRPRAGFWLSLILSSWKVESLAGGPPLVRPRQSHSPVERFTTHSNTGRFGYRVEFSRQLSRLKTEAAAASNEMIVLAEQYDPNGIVPETKSIPESMQFYAKFVIQSFMTNRLKKATRHKTTKRGDRTKSFLEGIAKLNEHRKNLVTLAGYNANIVIPSFGFLFLGALLTSIVPLYEAKCIQLVATLHPSKHKVFEALVGLVASSTLASLFTGLRGSLFWLAGTLPRHEHYQTFFNKL